MYKLFLLLISVSFLACNTTNSKEKKFLTLNGRTMGTTYNVQYADSLQRNLQTELDSILKLLNKSMSTYDPSSSISQFNFGEDTIFQIDIHFAKVFELSKEVY